MSGCWGIQLLINVHPVSGGAASIFHHLQHYSADSEVKQKVPQQRPDIHLFHQSLTSIQTALDHIQRRRRAFYTIREEPRDPGGSFLEPQSVFPELLVLLVDSSVSG